jgi:hypothetical protein
MRITGPFTLASASRHPLDGPAVGLPGIHERLPARRGAVEVVRAERGLFGGDRPDTPLTAEQRAKRVDRHEKVAGVLLHHREQQIPSGVTRQPAVGQHRQTREQDLARLDLVAGESQRAFQHVSWGQHAEFVPELT